MEDEIKRDRVLAVQRNDLRQAKTLNQSAHPLAKRKSGCTSG